MVVSVERGEVTGEALVLTPEEQELLRVYRKAKLMGFADISVSIQNGLRVKFWLTEKISNP